MLSESSGRAEVGYSSIMVARILTAASWAVPPLVLAVVLGLTVGFLPVWILYWAINETGVWLYCDSKGPNHLRRKTYIKRLSLVLLPSGFVGLMAGGGGLTPREAASTGSPDRRIREESARAPHGEVGPNTP